MVSTGIADIYIVPAVLDSWRQQRKKRLIGTLHTASSLVLERQMTPATFPSPQRASEREIDGEGERESGEAPLAVMSDIGL